MPGIASKAAFILCKRYAGNSRKRCGFSRQVQGDMWMMDDINAFAEQNETAMKAADEYARRAEKGTPSDRWADGSNGEHLVAQGIHAKNRMLEMFASVTLELIQAQKDAGSLSMALGEPRKPKPGVKSAI